jgi:hypothetical protein
MSDSVDDNGDVLPRTNDASSTLTLAARATPFNTAVVCDRHT